MWEIRSAGDVPCFFRYRHLTSRKANEAALDQAPPRFQRSLFSWFSDQSGA